MSFIRSFNQAQQDKMTGGDNAKLFNRLKADVLKGEVFPAVRKNELHFYYKGGCLYKFSGSTFKRDKNYEKFGVGLKSLPPYEKAKKENEIKFTNAAGGVTERRLLDGLYGYTFNPEKSSDIVVLDIEVNLGGQAVKKCDLALLNTHTDEIMFVEGKVFSDSRISVRPPNMPEVIQQVNTYTGSVAGQKQNILEQYAKHTEVINGLFGTSYRPPKSLIEPAKLLVYEVPRNPKKNGEYSIAEIDAKLGANNVLWIEAGENPSPEFIWTSLAGKVKNTIEEK